MRLVIFEHVRLPCFENWVGTENVHITAPPLAFEELCDDALADPSRFNRFNPLARVSS